MNGLKVYGAMIALAGLAACGGGVAQVEEQQALSDTALQALLNTHIEEFGADILAERFFDPAAFATEGEATYAGAIGIMESTGRDTSVSILDAQYVSPITFDVDLGNGDIVGRATAFVDSDADAPIEGNVTITASLNRVDPTGFGASGRLDGSLDLIDGKRAELDGEFLGDFFGDGGEAFDADSDGSFDVFDTTGALSDSDSFAYDADIISERVVD